MGRVGAVIAKGIIFNPIDKVCNVCYIYIIKVNNTRLIANK